MCLYDRGEKFEDDPDAFKRFVAQKFGIDSDRPGWDVVLQVFSGPEQDAYKDLVEVFQEYLESTKIEE